jgi:hypothetical protein
MLYAIILVVLFLLLLNFAFYLLPYLLPVFVVWWIYRLIKRPSVRVQMRSYSSTDSLHSSYTGSRRSSTGNSYTSNPHANYTSPSSSARRTRPALEDVIDAEFVDRQD